MKTSCKLHERACKLPHLVPRSPSHTQRQLFFKCLSAHEFWSEYRDRHDQCVVVLRSHAKVTSCRLRADGRTDLYYALILSRLGLVLGMTALILSLSSIHSGKRWGYSMDVVSTLSMIGLGLVMFSLMLAAASSRL